MRKCDGLMNKSINSRTGNRQWIVSSCLVASLVLLSGCQTIKKFQCNNKNWYDVGINDGQAGKGAEDTFNAHNAECTAVGTVADSATYRKGYDEGILKFCTADNGESRALDGFENESVCPASVASVFNTGFENGLALLCTEEGGRQLGNKVGVYRGTCSADTQRTFLQRYIPELEFSKRDAISKQVVATANLTAVTSSLATLDASISSYDTQISSAKKSGYASLEKSLKSSRAPLLTQRTKLKRLERKHNSEKSAAEKKISTATEMIDKWRLVLNK